MSEIRIDFAPCSLFLKKEPLVQKEVTQAMRKYELLYILAPTVEEDQIKETIERYNNVLKNNGAEIEKVDEMGKRRLAYEINDFKDGYYVVVYTQAEPAAIDEFDRLIKIDDNVIRHLVVKDED